MLIIGFTNATNIHHINLVARSTVMYGLLSIRSTSFAILKVSPSQIVVQLLQFTSWKKSPSIVTIYQHGRFAGWD